MLKKREKQSNIVNRRDKNPDGSQLISYVYQKKVLFAFGWNSFFDME